MNELVKLAEKIATHAHQGQFRRDGITPYITHPKAVVSRVESDSVLQAVAWLHDVLEDTDETEETLLEKGIPENVIQSVKVLTLKSGLSYNAYLERVAQDPIATKVKIADMLSNLSDNPTKKQIRKYAKGLLYFVKD